MAARITDDELRAALFVVRSALTEPGRFGFETRNPAVREWERWTPQVGFEVTDRAGAPVRVLSAGRGADVGGAGLVLDDVHRPGWDRPEVSRSTLRLCA